MRRKRPATVIDPVLRAEMAFDLPPVLDDLPGAVAVFDADERLVSVNRPFHHLIWRDLPAAQPGTDIATMTRTLLRTGTVVPGEKEEEAAVTEALHRHRNPPSETVLYLADGRRIRVQTSALAQGGLIALYTDATEPERRVEDLSKTADRLARLVEQSNDGYWDHDFATGELWVSPSLVALTGPIDAAGSDPLRPFGDHVHIDDRGAFEAAIAAQLRGDRSLDIELRLRTRWGAFRWMRARGRARFDVAGRPVRLTGSLQDIGDHRRALADLRDRSDGLTRARDEAATASRARSEFLAVVSHEIRTPLNGILGMARLLQSTHLTGEQKRYADSLHMSASLLLNLVNDMLDLSRLDAGRIQLDIGPFDLHHLVDGVLNVVMATAHEKKLDLSATIAPGLVARMIGDEGRLRQILINLAGNAVKFTDRGHVRITLSPVTTEGHLVTVRFAVIDTGIGVDGKDRDRIFGRFTQAGSTAARKHGGTGLGLAICKHLVELMGGRIGLESELGRGSTFWFDVPLVEDGVVAVRASAAAKPRPAGPRGRLRILLADDNSINQDYMAALLSKGGHCVDIVGNGQAAVEAAGRGIYDVVLMDVQMPGMDGIAATRAIRALPGKAGQVPIVALTANALAGDRERYLSAGMTDYVAKPVTIDELVDAMERSTGQDVAIPDMDAEESGDASLSPETEDAIAEFLDSLDDDDPERKS